MKKIAAAIIITALVLGAIYGAVSGSAAAISLSGVDNLLGDSEAVNNLACPICSTAPTPTPTPVP